MKIFVLILSLAVSVFASSNQKIKIFTEHYPPYNMKVAGELQGLSVDILSQTLKQMNSTQTKSDVKLTTWSRAYSIVQKLPNSMVFSTTRTEQRENLFKWVGPVSQTHIGIIALKNKNIVLNKVSDINNYKVGAVLKDVGEQLLLSNGIAKKNIQYVNGVDAINLSFTKMEKGRIDMFVYDTSVALQNAKNEGFDTSKYEVIHLFETADLYFAFNKDTDDKVINKWQKALDEVKQKDIYKEIINKYK